MLNPKAIAVSLSRLSVATISDSPSCWAAARCKASFVRIQIGGFRA